MASLLSSARHELRSPLQSIQGFGELLDCGAYGALGHEQQAFVRHILQGSSELGAIIEACLELTELSTLGRPLELQREDFQHVVVDALAHAERSCRVAIAVRTSALAEGARTKVDASAVRRAVEAVVTAVAAGGHAELTADIGVDGEHGRLTIGRMGTAGAALPPCRTIEELAQQRRTSRSLVWLQLASLLVTKQDGQLASADNGERVEVRLRLSSTH
jgi:K+-sensing histidine kinase KdpD